MIRWRVRCTDTVACEVHRPLREGFFSYTYSFNRDNAVGCQMGQEIRLAIGQSH